MGLETLPALEATVSFFPLSFFLFLSFLLCFLLIYAYIPKNPSKSTANELCGADWIKSAQYIDTRIQNFICKPSL